MRSAMDAGRFVPQKRERLAGRVVATALRRRTSNASAQRGAYKTKRPALAAGRSELIRQNEPAWLKNAEQNKEKPLEEIFNVLHFLRK